MILYPYWKIPYRIPYGNTRGIPYEFPHGFPWTWHGIGWISIRIFIWNSMWNFYVEIYVEFSYGIPCGQKSTHIFLWVQLVPRLVQINVETLEKNPTRWEEIMRTSYIIKLCVYMEIGSEKFIADNPNLQWKWWGKCYTYYGHFSKTLNFYVTLYSPG